MDPDAMKRTLEELCGEMQRYVAEMEILVHEKRFASYRQLDETISAAGEIRQLLSQLNIRRSRLPPDPRLHERICLLIERYQDLEGACKEARNDRSER